VETGIPRFPPPLSNTTAHNRGPRFGHHTPVLTCNPLFQPVLCCSTKAEPPASPFPSWLTSRSTNSSSCCPSHPWPSVGGFLPNKGFQRTFLFLLFYICPVVLFKFSQKPPFRFPFDIPKSSGSIFLKGQMGFLFLPRDLRQTLFFFFFPLTHSSPVVTSTSHFESPFPLE